MTYKARIKFDNTEWLVMDSVEFEGTKYYYIIEDISEELNNLKSLEDYNGKFTMEFIYQVPDGNYCNVTDQKLIDILLAMIGKKLLLSKKDFE